MIPEGPLPFTAQQAARQQAILAAEIAAGWIEPPPDAWQLADPDDSLPENADAWAEDLLWSMDGNSPAATGSAAGTCTCGGGTSDNGASGRDVSGAPSNGAPRRDTPGGRASSRGVSGGVMAGDPGWVDPVPCGIVAHDADGPGGAGFASGSVLDSLRPGPVLTGCLDDTWTAGLDALPDDELAGVILAWRRTESHALAGQLAAVGELHRRRMAHPDRHVGEHAADELAILLTLTGRPAIALMDQAAALSRLPATMAALRAGLIDRSKASVIIFETELLDDQLAAAVEQLVIEDAPGQTTAKLRIRLRNAVLAADPDAVRRRKEKAAQDARVELHPEMSGNAELSGRELPVAAALMADARIDAAARALKASGLKARLTQLRAAVFLGLLTGHDPLSFLPADSGDAASGSDDPASGDATAAPGPGEATRDPDTTPNSTTPSRSAPSDTSSDGTTSDGGASDRTAPGGTAPGGGASDRGGSTDAEAAGAQRRTGSAAGDARERADSAPVPGSSAGPGLGSGADSRNEPQAGNGPDSRNEPHAGNGPDSQNEPHAGNGADSQNEPHAGNGADSQNEPGLRNGPGGGPTISGSVHLTVPLTTWLGLTDSPGEIPGYGGADGDISREIAEHIAASPGSRWCLTITSPTGRAIAHACARRPPPGSAEARASWLGKMKITRIEAGTCTHAREVPGYRIPDSLHHIVKTRQRTCSGPSCNRPAARCDTDHTLAYDKGGRTCECALAPLCRKHHQAKQTEGWHLEQPEPGILVWRLPHGRTYVVTPSIYPT